MKMPQDFVDAINKAVREVNPEAGQMVSGSFTLGSDFDDLLYSEEAMTLPLEVMVLKQRFDDGEDVEAELKEKLEALVVFERKFAERFNEKRDELKKAMVDSCVETEKKRMAGTLVSDGPVKTGRERVNLKELVSDVMKQIESGDYEEIDPLQAD